MENIIKFQPSFIYHINYVPASTHTHIHTYLLDILFNCWTTNFYPHPTQISFCATTKTLLAFKWRKTLKLKLIFISNSRGWQCLLRFSLFVVSAFILNAIPFARVCVVCCVCTRNDGKPTSRRAEMVKCDNVALKFCKRMRLNWTFKPKFVCTHAHTYICTIHCMSVYLAECVWSGVTQRRVYL